MYYLHMYKSACSFRFVNIGSCKYSFFGSAAKTELRVSFDSLAKHRSNPEEKGRTEDTIQKHSRLLSHLNFGSAHLTSSGWHLAGTH
jgi:hypothetical protein